MAGGTAELGLDELFADVQAVAADYRGVYLVGGAVRDLLLEGTSTSTSPSRATASSSPASSPARLKGRVRAHAQVPDGRGRGRAPRWPRAGRLRVDVASTRTEFYDFPAALPKVEHAPIRSDLARRDFTVNAMAMSST